jgi:hypothetical protein
LTYLSPFRLLTIGGSLNLVRNESSDVRPLINAIDGVAQMDLSNNEIRDAEMLARSFAASFVLDFRRRGCRLRRRGRRPSSPHVPPTRS